MSNELSNNGITYNNLIKEIGDIHLSLTSVFNEYNELFEDDFENKQEFFLYELNQDSFINYYLKGICSDRNLKYDLYKLSEDIRQYIINNC
jgi:hypothetical protein